jgi:cysteine desulfurase NifS
MSVNKNSEAVAGRAIRNGLCGICPAGCWVCAHLEDGVLTKVEAQPDVPLGTICRIGKHSPEIVYDPDRVKYPLRRTGAKGTHAFEQISWDDAFEIIVDKLTGFKDQYGPESTAIFTGRGSFDMAMCDLMQPAGVAISSASSVLFPFGSPNTLGVGALCYVSFAMIAPHVTMGEMYMTMDTDLENAELIVVWGANPATDSPPFSMQQIIRAKERGARVVVIDPRCSETVRLTGAEWLPIRPGTDGALALGMINVLVEEELFDEDFAENWTTGFPELCRLVQHFRPEVVAHITGVPEEKIRELARAITNARGASPVMYTGLEYSDSGVQAIRAVFTLWGLAGQLDVPGGLLIRMRDNVFPQNRDHLQPNPDMIKALGRDRFPIYSAYRGESHAIALPQSVLEGIPYKIRGMIILGGSIITAWPNPPVWKKTLGALDFLVTIDRYHTADSAYADIVLPATTQYETTSYMRYGPIFKIREKMIEPVGEARNDFLILAELAERLGYGHLYPQTEEAVLERALENTGFTVEEVRKAGGSVQVEPVMMQYKKWQKGLLRDDGSPGFNTPSGKFEIASSILAEHGYDPLPNYTEPLEGPHSSPGQAKDFPLVFNSGARTYYDFRSQHHGVKSLCAMQPDPMVTINTRDAAERNICDNDRVRVSTPRGSVTFRARVTDAIVSGAIDAGMGGGGPLGPKSWQECNVNELTDLEHYDPISGFPIYKSLLCDVERIDQEEEAIRTIPAVQEYACSDVVLPIAAVHNNNHKVYLDHNATTPLDPEVLQKMMPYLQDIFGNPSSIHTAGSRARRAVEEARRSVANLLNCTARRIIFTSGGSESNNLAIRGTVQATGKKSGHLITSTIEHLAALLPFKALEEQGFTVTRLPVNRQGLVDAEELARAITKDTLLISVMLANNEFGTIQPIKELAAIAREHNVLFHTDAVQGMGKIGVDVQDLDIDLLSISAHKIYGPKGVGALYIKKGVKIAPLIQGGGQEHGIRSGTENVPAIIGFGKACELAGQRLQSGMLKETGSLRDYLFENILEKIPGARRIGSITACLPNTLSITLPGIRGESLVLLLDQRGIFLSAGSACKSGNASPSHALLALGISEDEAHCTVRFSLGGGTTKEGIDCTVNALEELHNNKQEVIRFVPCR